MVIQELACTETGHRKRTAGLQATNHVSEHNGRGEGCSYVPDRKRTCIDDREEALRSGTWKLRKGRKKNDEAYHDCESKAKIMASWSAVDQHAQHEAAPPAMRG
jgi:hypothetical protein